MAILHTMDIQPGHFCRLYCEETDVFRIKNVQRHAKLASKELRKARMQLRLGLEEQEAAREGHPYQAGGFWLSSGETCLSLLYVESLPKTSRCIHSNPLIFFNYEQIFTKFCT